MKKNKPKLPTVRESLATISQSLQGIAASLQDSRGDNALALITEALLDLAEYGPGKVPKSSYSWRDAKGG